MKNVNWKNYFGCVGWFDMRDGHFVIATQTKAYKAAGSSGPCWIVLGEKEDDLLISTDGIFTGTTPKKFVRFLEPYIFVDEAGDVNEKIYE